MKSIDSACVLLVLVALISSVKTSAYATTASWGLLKSFKASYTHLTSGETASIKSWDASHDAPSFLRPPSMRFTIGIEMAVQESPLAESAALTCAICEHEASKTIAYRRSILSA
uniref:Putative secreted protein fat body overexpressed n=1 Tax=Rhipicephalus microplus TaxID=6941 RepID=A0A6M2D8W9_RHIMP